MIAIVPVLLACVSLSSSAQVGEWPDPSHRPKYKTWPRDVEARLGARVVLPCRTTQLEERVQWTRNAFGLGFDRELAGWDRFRIVGNDQYDWNLEIRNVSLSDDGLYDCQIFGSRSPSARLSVLVPPRQPYIHGGSVIEAIENEKITLTCVSKGGKPAPRMNWYEKRNGEEKRLLSNAKYSAVLMDDYGGFNPDMGPPKLFTATSVVDVTPSKDAHNATFVCEVWNAAQMHARHATIRLEVRYPPSVEIDVLRPGSTAPKEGERVLYQCKAMSNPAAYRYQWFRNDRAVPGQFGHIYEITNVTKTLDGTQLKCSAENELGRADGVLTIKVLYGPSFLLEPPTLTPIKKTGFATLPCVVKSQPRAKYFWTKDDSRQIISRSQNLTLPMGDHRSGVYYCHASVNGFPGVKSRAAEVVAEAPPFISSPSEQSGILGDDIHLECAAGSVPKPTDMYWTFHGQRLDESNSHYRIVDSFISNSFRSTLIIRQSIELDFGVYTCHVTNDLGKARLDVRLTEKFRFPSLDVSLGVLVVLVLILVLVIVVIACRKRLCSSSKKKSKRNNVVVANNLMINSNGDSGGVTNLKDLENASLSLNGGGDSAFDGSEGDAANNLDVNGAFLRTDGGGNVPLTQMMIMRQGIGVDPEFPPKPDVVTAGVAGVGYVPYGCYMRDFSPAPPPPHANNSLNNMEVGEGGRDSPLYPQPTTMAPETVANQQSPMLNVTDPRFSATYGNPYLKQQNPLPGFIGDGGMSYSTFLPTSTTSIHHPPPAPVSPAPSSSAASGYPHHYPTNTISSLGCYSGGGYPAATSVAPGFIGSVSYRPPSSSTTSANCQMLSGPLLPSSSTPNSSVSNIVVTCLPEENSVGGSTTSSSTIPLLHNQNGGSSSSNNDTPSPPTVDVGVSAQQPQQVASMGTNV